MNTRAIAIITCLVLATQTLPVRATLIAYEPFDLSVNGYAIDETRGQNPNSFGFVGEWIGNDTNDSSSSLIFGSSLTHPAIPSSGGAIVNIGAGVRVSRKLATTYDDSSNATLWVSWLFQHQTPEGTPYNGLEFHNDTISDGSIPDSARTFHAGLGNAFGASTHYGFRVNNDNNLRALTNVAANMNIDHLMLLKIELSSASEADSVTMWVDPADVSSEAALGAGTTVSGFDLQIAYLSLAKFLAPDNSFAAFDEIRIATDLQSAISGVPEPASLMLVGLGGLLMLRRRVRG